MMKYPKRFFKNQFYIGVKTKERVAPYSDWEDRLSIRRFRGKPYNKYEYTRIIEYDEQSWQNLLGEIREEAQHKNLDVETTEDYAYTIPKWRSFPSESNKMKCSGGKGQMGAETDE